LLAESVELVRSFERSPDSENFCDEYEIVKFPDESGNARFLDVQISDDLIQSVRADVHLDDFDINGS
jgi:hypothetical protein